mmetsp:Transcript_14310/g.40497  ORF Transcript_14310/g.40497 Transcript_14310/m.40497 type:complete len:243 (-) Transcript_14310:136-864(-)
MLLEFLGLGSIGRTPLHFRRLLVGPDHVLLLSPLFSSLAMATAFSQRSRASVDAVEARRERRRDKNMTIGVRLRRVFRGSRIGDRRSGGCGRARRRSILLCCRTGCARLRSLISRKAPFPASPFEAVIIQIYLGRSVCGLYGLIGRAGGDLPSGGRLVAGLSSTSAGAHLRMLLSFRSRISVLPLDSDVSAARLLRLQSSADWLVALIPSVGCGRGRRSRRLLMRRLMRRRRRARQRRRAGG